MSDQSLTQEEVKLEITWGRRRNQETSREKRQNPKKTIAAVAAIDDASGGKQRGYNGEARRKREKTAVETARRI